jgi:hypothetical protein
MTSAVFDNAPIKLMTGLVNIQANSTTTFCVLGPTADAPVKATWATYNDIKWAASSPFEIAAVNGYALGGSGVATVVPTVTSAVVGLKTSAPLVFTTNATITAQYAIIQSLINSGSPTSTTTTNPLHCYLDLGAQQVTNGTLTLTWAAAGIYTMTVAAAS